MSKDTLTTDQKWERAADLGADAVIEFLVYQGDNPRYFRRAKVGLGAGAIFVKKFSANQHQEALRQMAATRNVTKAIEK